MLEVRKSRPEDFGQIMDIYRSAQEFMIASGNPDQWGHFYPTEEMVREDIRTGIGYVICDGEAICGACALCEGAEPTYQQIYEGGWLNDEPYITIHRIAGKEGCHGIVAAASDYCKSIYDNVRIDTHHNNLVMQRQIEKNGFVNCGVIYVEDGSARVAYHWVRE
ncbi:MAG: N-acetyltransferase [Bacillota bacterium]|nr:N-acetyltransferase [Bacillota bacterium]